jgi:carbon-monoxide dehydrogenase iron sulfur subunit
MGKVITVDIERCLACKGCVIACALAHSQSKVLELAIAESPRPQPRVSVEATGESAVPMQCRHCEDAPCIAVCPTGAINRHGPEDPVLINQDLCIGCKFCLAVCPFGVISLAVDGRAMVKCDLCIERTKAGQEPACVEACPTKALKLADEKDVAANRRHLAAKKLASTANQDNNKQEQDNK